LDGSHGEVENMINYIKDGWETTKYHPWIITVLFVYQFIWGFFIYKFIQSIALPLLHRFPGTELSESSVQIFLAEAQFQLLKTDAAHSFLWTLLVLLLVRMVLTPLFNAGIYYSIQQPGTQQIRPFFQGVKRMGIPFLLIYCIQMAVTLIPLYWIFPYIQQVFMTQQHGYEALFLAAVPVILGYYLYAAFIRLCCMYIQFGKVSSFTLLHSIQVLLRYILPILGISCLLFAVAGFTALLSLSVSMIWAGFFAVVLHQMYHLVRSIFKVWEISAQHRLWSSKSTI
jgi:hypothetical protein